MPRRPLESEPIEAQVLHCRGEKRESVWNFCKLSEPSGIREEGRVGWRTESL